MEKLYNVNCLLFDVDSVFYTNPHEHQVHAGYQDLLALMEMPPSIRMGAFTVINGERLWRSQNYIGAGWRVPCDSNREDLWQDLTQALEEHSLEYTDCLLVSRNSDIIKAATPKGFLTCFVAGETAAQAVQETAADITVADLNQMEYGLKALFGKPIRYRVTATAVHEKYSREFVRWMRDEHGHELLAVPGCQEFRVFRVDPVTVTCEYIFRHQRALNDYVTYHAEALRKKGRERFPEEIMMFSRDDNTLEVQGLK